MSTAMECEHFDVVLSVSQILHHASLASTGVDQSKIIATPFDASRMPTISMQDYARRLQQGFRCSRESYILCLVYVERILERNDGLVVTASNVHRLFLTALVIALKYNDDIHGRNSFYATIGGVIKSELATMEACFMRMLGWRAHVTDEEYKQCLTRACSLDASMCMPKQKAIGLPSFTSSPPTLAKPVLLTGPNPEQSVVAVPDAAVPRQVPEVPCPATLASSKGKHGAMLELRRRLTRTCQRRSRKRSAMPMERVNYNCKRVCRVAHQCLTPLTVLQ